MEASLQLAGLVLRSAGVETGAVDLSLKAHRDGNYRALADRKSTD